MTIPLFESTQDKETSKIKAVGIMISSSFPKVASGRMSDGVLWEMSSITIVPLHMECS